MENAMGDGNLPPGCLLSDIDALSAPDLSNEADERLEELESFRDLMVKADAALGELLDALERKDRRKSVSDLVVCEQSEDSLADARFFLKPDLKEVSTAIERIWEWDAERARAGVR